METKLTTEELGNDISSVDSLLKKQQLHESDIKAHEVHATIIVDSFELLLNAMHRIG